MTGESPWSEPIEAVQHGPSTSSGRSTTGSERLTPGAAQAHGVPVLPGRLAKDAGIVHLGLSNFHRAHQAVYTARALQLQDGPWGIVGVARQSREVLDAMRQQEQAYAVLTLDNDRADVDVLAVHSEVVLATTDPERVVERLADSATSIVTVTVTEAGYTFDPRRVRGDPTGVRLDDQGTGGLDLGRPELRADLKGRAPLTTVGQLARALRRRHRADGHPLTVLSCDNLVGNGALLRGLVTEFLERTVPGAELAELLAWCEQRVRFPGSMVDRIVPRTSDRHRELVQQRTGLSDRCPVPAEAFSMWVIEDDFPTPVPAWDRVGAILSRDVQGYEVLKIRMLNGTHSLIAYLGMLIGARTIDEAVADPAVRDAAEAFLDEMSTTLEVPAEVSLAGYRESLLHRFENSATGHRTSQVGSDGSLKVPARIPGPVAVRSAAGQQSPMAALLAATFVRVLTDPAATAPAVRNGLRDPALRSLTAVGAHHDREEDRVRAVLVDSGLFPASLAAEDAFADDCVQLAEICRRAGVRAAIRAAVEQAAPSRRGAPNKEPADA